MIILFNLLKIEILMRKSVSVTFFCIINDIKYSFYRLFAAFGVLLSAHVKKKHQGTDS